MAPAEVRIAFGLWRAGVVAAVASSALSIPIVDDLVRLRGQVLPADLDPLQSAVDLRAGAVGGTVVSAGFAALLMFVALRMRAGCGWARTTLTVVGAVAIVVGLLGVGETVRLFAVGPLGVLVALLRLVTLALTAAAISYMFRPGSTAWFALPAA